MSRSLLGIQMLFSFVFIIGIGVDAFRYGRRCTNLMLEVPVNFDSAMNQTEDEQIRWICGSMTGILSCIDDVVKEDYGLTMRELASALKDDNFGKNLQLVVNLEDVVHEFCTPGSQLQEDFLENAQCFRDVIPGKMNECAQQSKEAFQTFRSNAEETNGRLQREDRLCINMAYKLGCLGAAVHEGCGDKALETYKEFVRKIGFLKSGPCSPDIVQTIKTSFVESLDELESRKNLYRVIFDLKRRRK